LVDRNFTTAVPNMLWVADLTYIKTLQGILYLAVVLDVCSGKVVGWQMADRMTTDLVLSALEMGLWHRDVARNRLIHHSDKGSQGGFQGSRRMALVLRGTSDPCGPAQPALTIPR